MSNVALSIGGRRFTVACAEGEEAHVLSLGTTIDGKLAAMDGMSSQSESRMLLFAALLLADELHEAGANPSPEPQPALQAAGAAWAQLAERLGAFAAKVENLADRLES